MTLPVLDDDRLRAVSGGDAVLEIELVDMLIEEAEPLVADLARLSAETDRDAAHECSHSLKGIAGNVGAIELRDAASALDAVLVDTVSPWNGFAGQLTSVVRALDGVRAARASRSDVLERG